MQFESASSAVCASLGAASLSAASSALAVLALVAGPLQAKSHSNSLVRLPHGSALVDFDGDGLEELAQSNSNQLYINDLDFAGTGRAHFYFDQEIRELVTGRFSGRPASDIGALLADGTFECIRWEPELSAFVTWLSVPAFAATSERFVVGDFDGDGTDELLIHDPASGAYRFLRAQTIASDPRFVPLDVDPGQLPDRLRDREVYAGEFGQSPSRADLLVFDRATGTISRYDSVPSQNETSNRGTTFWWAFTSAASSLGAAEWLAIGNFDGAPTDSIVAYDTLDGTTRFWRAEFDRGRLAAIDLPNAQLGSSTAPGSRPFPAKLARWNGELGSELRDDLLFYDAGRDAYVRSDARHSDVNAYWWAFTKEVRRYDREFAPLGPIDEWRVVACVDSDVPAPDWFTVGTFEWLYAKSGRNTPNMYNFFKDMSYGAYHYVATVAPIAKLATPEKSRARSDTWAQCVQATSTDVSKFAHVLAITNGDDDFGSQGAVTTLATWQATWTGTPTHEMGHALGLPHVFDDSQSNCSGAPGEYCDPTDPMGSPYAYVWGVDFKLGGTGFSVADAYSSVSRALLGWIPAARSVNVVSSAQPSTRTVQLAALDRPESPGALVATIEPSGDPNDSYYVEFRSKSGRWDRAFPSDAVVVHHFAPNAAWGRSVGYLQTHPTSLLQPGQAFEAPKGIAVRVLDFDSRGGTATVELDY